MLIKKNFKINLKKKNQKIKKNTTIIKKYNKKNFKNIKKNINKIFKLKKKWRFWRLFKRYFITKKK